MRLRVAVLVIKYYVAESFAKVVTHVNSISALTVSQIFSSIKNVVIDSATALPELKQK